MVAHFVDDALEDAGQFFVRQRTGVLRPGMREDLFPAAGIVDFFIEDALGGGDILDHAGAAIQQIDQRHVDIVDPFPAVL